MNQEEKTVSTPAVVENAKKGALIVSNTIDTSILTNSESRLVKYTTLDPENEEDADILLASQEVDEKLNNEVGKTLKVIGHIISEYPKTIEDEETGEIREYKDHSFVLITEDGKTHACGSSYAYRCYAEIVAMKRRTPSRENPMYLKVVKKPVKGDETKSYLGLVYVKEDK